MTKIKRSHHVFTDAEAAAYRGSMRHFAYKRRGPLIILGTLLIVIALFASFGVGIGGTLSIMVSVGITIYCGIRFGDDVSIDPVAELSPKQLNTLAQLAAAYPEIRSWLHGEVEAGTTLRLRDYLFACSQADALKPQADAARRKLEDAAATDAAKSALRAAVRLDDSSGAAPKQQDS